MKQGDLVKIISGVHKNSIGTYLEYMGYGTHHIIIGTEVVMYFETEFERLDKNEQKTT